MLLQTRNKNMMEKILFTDDAGESTAFYVLEQTTLGGINYLLVTETENGDSDAYILKELSLDDSGEVSYEMVEDEKTMKALASVFSELIEDVDIDI